MKPSVITRFPPSPTGYFHIGSARTALFNYLFARHEGGEMVLRFEDTDRERSKKEFEDDIVHSLKWLGLSYTLPQRFRQSERTDIYKNYLTALIEGGRAHEAEGGKDNPDKKVIRFKNPGTKITFHDLVRGEVTFDTQELGDFVIAKSADEPLYHLAVVIDDYEMGVTHVIRGEDHLSNTARQILILEALGFTRPLYAHIPLILASDRTKLSKRHGAVSLGEYREQGFIPEAVLNYLALLGWNPGGEQEVFTLEELIAHFTLERVHKGGAIFDIEKLTWFNHEHLKKLSDGEFLERLTAYINAGPLPEYIPKVISLIRDRSQTLGDARQAIEAGEFGFMEEEMLYPAELLIQGAKVDAAMVKNNLQKVSELLQVVSDEDFTAEKVKGIVFPYATQQGRAAVLWPLRVALSGREKSPDPFTLCALLRKQKTLERIENAAQML